MLTWERKCSHYEGNLASTTSRLFVMHALLNANLSLVLKIVCYTQIGCLTRKKTTFV